MAARRSSDGDRDLQAPWLAILDDTVYHTPQEAGLLLPWQVSPQLLLNRNSSPHAILRSDQMKNRSAVRRRVVVVMVRK